MKLFEKFNKDLLIAELNMFDCNRTLAFALSCAERLYPNYLIFEREEGEMNREVLADALNNTWLLVNGEKWPPEEIADSMKACESSTPYSDDFDSLFVSSAQDACLSVCCILDYLLKPDLERIAQVASYAIDSVDLYVQEIENMEPHSPNLEQNILYHPLMQQELCLQKRALAELKNLSSQKDFFSNFQAGWRKPQYSCLGLKSP